MPGSTRRRNRVPRGSAELRAVEQPMSTEAPVGLESDDTTTDASTEDHDLPDAVTGPYVPRDVSGGVAIEAQAFRRTSDGAVLRFDGTTPTHIVGLCSVAQVCESLSEYSRAEIDRAIERGKQLEREKPKNANQAIRVAERETVEAMEASDR